MPVDSNRDGKVDQFKIKMRIKKPLASQALQQLNLIVAFDLELKETVKMRMEGIANVNINPIASSTLSASKLRTQGNLVLK